MPERLFETVTNVQLRKCAESEPERIFTLLPRSKQDLLSWLVQLLARVALEPDSKMDPFNLGKRAFPQSPPSILFLTLLLDAQDWW